MRIVICDCPGKNERYMPSDRRCPCVVRIAVGSFAEAVTNPPITFRSHLSNLDHEEIYCKVRRRLLESLFAG